MAYDCAFVFRQNRLIPPYPPFKVGSSRGRRRSPHAHGHWK